MSEHWQYLPDFGEVRDLDNLERCIVKLAPELNWHDLTDEERAWWDELGDAIVDLARPGE